MRQFIYRLRKKFGIGRWCWKMEFHQPDPDTGLVYPHWHLLIDYKRPIDAGELNRAWGKGRTEIKGVRDRALDYVFKYACKDVEDIPEWVQEMKVIRLFQSSPDFFPADGAAQKNGKASPRPAVETTDGDTQKDEVRRELGSIRERIERWSRTVVSRSLSDDGVHHRYRAHQLVDGGWAEFLVQAAQHKLLAFVGDPSLRITSTKIEASCLIQLPRWPFLYALAS